jgi:NADPH-dependent ferric siderophore reductase
MPTPRVVRVVAHGDLADWPEPAAAAHLEVFLPDTPVGPVARTYTVRDWDRPRRRVTIDFALNSGAGPATQWASRVVVGMRLEIAGQSHSAFTPPEQGGRYLFAGDATSLPAIATCVASLPMDAVACAIVELADALEQQPLESNAQLDVRWLYAETSDAGFADAVLGAAATLEPSDVWVACEAGAVRSIRRSLLSKDFPAAQLETRGYWKRGEPDYRDDDTGADDWKSAASASSGPRAI